MKISGDTWDKLRKFEPIDPFGRYVATASVLEVIPDIALLAMLMLLLNAVGVDVGALHGDEPRSLKFISVVIYAPAFETFVLAGFIELLSRFVKNPLAVTIVSAACWGLVHALRSPLSFFGVTIGFFVQSYSYVAWRKRSFVHGYASAFIPHAMNNLVALALFNLQWI